MVARSPPKLQLKKNSTTAAAAPPPPLDPTLLRETINKVDKAIARLQELQFTVTGGEMVVSGGVTLSPRSTRGYLKTSLVCKQQTLRMKNTTARRSPTGNLPAKNTGDWKRMSLPAMLLGETVGEILQASQFARQIVEAADDDPKTPLLQRKHKNPEISELPARRKREKQVALQTIRSDSNPVSLQRTKSRINFKVSSSSPIRNNDDCCEKENCRYIANRVSPRNKPWVKKTVLFPNPLYHSSTTSPNSASNNQSLGKNKSSPHAAARQTPHKFLIKSPPKIRSPQFTNPSILRRKKSPVKESGAAKFRRSFSPSRLANKLVSPLKSGKSVQENDGIKSSRRSFSPSRLVNKLASPLRNGKCIREDDGIKMMKMMMATTGHKKQRSPPKATTSAIGRSFSPTISKKRLSPPSKASSSSAIRKPLSPTTSMILRKRLSPPPKESAAAKLRRSFSPSRLATKLASPLKSRKSVSKNDGLKMKQISSSPPKVSSTNGTRRPFSPLKSKKYVPDNEEEMMISGLKQRPITRGTQIRI